MSENLLAGRIAQLRKEAGMTQEQLGNALGLTYQSVSKWENGLSCPDVQLLPQLADLFHVTLDDLFGREAPQPQRTAEQEEAERTLPWPDDDTLYAVMYHGHQLLTEEPAALRGHREELRFVYDGPAVNVSSWFDVVCRKGGDGFVFTTGERNMEVSDVAETVEDIRQTAKGLKDSLREMFRRKPSEEE